MALPNNLIRTQGGGYYQPGTGYSFNSLQDAERHFAQMDQRSSWQDPSYYNSGVDYDKAWQSQYGPEVSLSQMQAIADPNAARREQYANQLQALLENPDSISDSGVYKFAFDQGNKALQRSAAARGMTNSGNTLAELMRYGHGYASQQYGSHADRLAGLADLSRDNSNILSQYLGQKNARAAFGMNAAAAKAGDYWRGQSVGQDYSLGLMGNYRPSVSTSSSVISPALRGVGFTGTGSVSLPASSGPKQRYNSFGMLEGADGWATY